MRNVVKYVGIVLVIAGIILVMKNLFTQEDEWSRPKNKKDETTAVAHYSAKVQLLDKESSSFLSGATLVVKDEKGEVIDKWTTDGGVYLINSLKKGTYTVEQESAPDGYHKTDEKVLFTISDKDEEITIYNVKMTEQEIEETRLKNTTSNEVGVENTLSKKSIWSILGGVASIGIGVGLILYQKKSSSNDI